MVFWRGAGMSDSLPPEVPPELPAFWRARPENGDASEAGHETWQSGDFVGAFTLGGEDAASAHGQAARLGIASLDPILQRHDLPPVVASLAAEALVLAALLGAALKFEGRLILQAQGDGPVPMMIAEFASEKLAPEIMHASLRIYVRTPDLARLPVPEIGRRPALDSLTGQGLMSLTIDQGPDTELYQSVTPLEGARLDECMVGFFARSVQQEALLRIASARLVDENGLESWRAAGILVQRFAGDAARPDDSEDWNRIGILFSTLSDAELVDPAVSPGDLLFRLFHEEGIALFPPRILVEACSCNEARLSAILSRFTADEIAESLTEDGTIHAKCEFCARQYRIDPRNF